MSEEKMQTKKSVFATLREVNVTEKHKQKKDLTYLPWASAWASVKSLYPEATYTIGRSDAGNLYFTDGKTCRVETSVTIEGLTQGETLAVMDFKNQAIPYESITATNVDKAIKRCLTKNLALFGLDLNLWEGEDLSDEAQAIIDEKEKKTKEELDKAVKEVVETGTKLIAAGISKNDVMGIVGKFNNGAPNPSSIKTIEICESVMTEFKKKLNEVDAKKKPTEKVSTNTKTENKTIKKENK